MNPKPKCVAGRIFFQESMAGPNARATLSTWLAETCQSQSRRAYWLTHWLKRANHLDSVCVSCRWNEIEVWGICNIAEAALISHFYLLPLGLIWACAHSGTMLRESPVLIQKKKGRRRMMWERQFSKTLTWEGSFECYTPPMGLHS